MKIDHIALTVPDAGQATVFLKAVFGARVHCDGLMRLAPGRGTGG